MNKKNLQMDMKNQLSEKSLFEKSKTYAYEYIDGLEDMNVYPSEEALNSLSVFEEPMPVKTTCPADIIEMLHKYGSKATSASTGGKYFGFVNGGVLPVALATKWLSDTWDQNSALYFMSPISSKLEEVCEKWIVDLLGLDKNTVAGFVSGSSIASICGIAAARNELLLKQGYDVNLKGLFSAPRIRVIMGKHAHSTIWKALSILGIGKEMVEIVPTDPQGAMLISEMPPLDNTTLVIAQSGNVNGGAFDNLEEICERANRVGAWVHVDGAFGLWAAASKDKKYLTKGIEKADSCSVDAHKTLNSAYDCGIILCKNRSALINALKMSGSYIQFSDHRDGMLFTPEMSKRARSIELWSVLKYLGKEGVEQLVDALCENAVYFANKLSENGFTVCNDVCFNQIIVKCESPAITTKTLNYIQNSGKCWCGGAVWDDEPCIRISVCSWQTTKNDIEESVKVFIACRDKAGDSL